MTLATLLIAIAAGLLISIGAATICAMVLMAFNGSLWRRETWGLADVEPTLPGSLGDTPIYGQLATEFHARELDAWLAEISGEQS
jgi:hypothetical protein